MYHMLFEVKHAALRNAHFKSLGTVRNWKSKTSRLLSVDDVIKILLGQRTKQS